MMLLLLLLAPSSQPTATAPACIAYKSAVDEISRLGPTIALLRPGQTVTISPQGKELRQVRDKLARAMQAGNPDLDAIETLMRDELRLRAALGLRHQESKLGCELATLRGLDATKLRDALDIMRPRTTAELDDQRRSARVPPAPPPPPRP